jgi:hypothetical protein
MPPRTVRGPTDAKVTVGDPAMHQAVEPVDSGFDRLLHRRRRFSSGRSKGNVVRDIPNVGMVSTPRLPPQL